MGLCSSSESEGPINEKQIDASHFTLMKVVGQGGFGKVNAVIDRVSKQLLAMKRMKKMKLIQKPIYVSTAWRERDVMSKVKSPFLVNLIHAFQDIRYLYVIMPFLQGGDLRYYLSTKGKMNEDMVRFYAAEILLGLEELHSLHIVYRDLKPDNILLDAEGHCRISDFGLAVFLRKEDDYKTQGTAGTPGYQAPEVLEKNKWYGISADIWSFGIVLYELLQNMRPFTRTTASQDVNNYRSSDNAAVQNPDDTVSNDIKIEYETDISPEAKDLIEQLLIRDCTKRLGCMTDEGITVLKSHPFFSTIDWELMENRTLTSPFQPDTSRANCSGDFELHDQFFGDDGDEPTIKESQQENFHGFEFNVEYTPNEQGNKGDISKKSSKK